MTDAKLLRIVVVFFILASCQTSQLPNVSVLPGPEIPVSPPEEAPPIQEPPPRDSLTLVAAGDNLFHETLLASSRGKEGYNFAPVYAEVKSLVEKADLAFINQETVMGGEKLGYSGYPQFNTPQALAKTLAETGFDIVNHANNHAMDKGGAGLLATLDAWDAIPGVRYLGVQKTAEKPQLIITKNNISLGFLAYTYGTNGLALPKDKPWLVSLINRENMAKEIDALRPLCDFLIVSMHWGDEYAADPSAGQTSLAAFLAEHNVDLVIGHHPHVLQRFELIPRADGKNTYCFYSLGNFASNQLRKETILGGLMYVKFLKEGQETSIADAGLIPMVCHFDAYLANTRVFPLYSYTEDLLGKHWYHIRDKSLSLEYFSQVSEKLKVKVISQNPFAEEKTSAQ
ncbi:capsular polysaccharide biosynthesis protein [Spirochaetia bacterium]|nr:capsular polysaccharide biosynthesis protein [Spirochaetia bacterium]